MSLGSKRLFHAAVVAAGLFLSNALHSYAGVPVSGPSPHSQDDPRLEKAGRPGTTRPPLPDYQGSGSEPDFVLPPVPAPRQRESDLAAAPSVFVRRFKIVGHTVFSDEELSKVAAPFENREITSEELEELRYGLTLYYVKRGYINSGAVIPDQKVVDGVILVRVIEGRLSRVEVTGDTWLRSEYVSRRLLPRAGQFPLNMDQLQERLQLLQQDPLIQWVKGELGPGIALGESVLKVRVQEAKAYELGVCLDNHRSPSVGSFGMDLFAAHRDVTGWGDALEIRWGFTEGLDDLETQYTFPLTARETRLKLRYARSGSEVVEEPFDRIDIKSESETYGITLSQPFFRTPGGELLLALTGERRHSETYLLGRPFSFSRGAHDGKSDVAVLRLSQQWLTRSRSQVLAVRSMFSLGVDGLGSTKNPTSPDGEFFTWLGQFQWARRLARPEGSQIICRTDLQLSKDPLLPLEKFAVGGADTVRGYRENQLVRDNGLVSSLELRIPLPRVPLHETGKGADLATLQFAPFADWGWSWNTDSPTPYPDIIFSLGLGLRWDPTSTIQARVYWAIPFRDLEAGSYDLQDSGIHFQVSCRLF